MYEDVKLEEDPNLIHDICVTLQEKQIVNPWQLKQTPREFLEKLFPMDTLPRHLVGVLHVQEVLRNRASTEASGNGSLAKAMVKLVREQNKKNREDKDIDRASDSDAERKQFNFSQCMKVYHLNGIPQARAPSVHKNRTNGNTSCSWTETEG